MSSTCHHGLIARHGGGGGGGIWEEDMDYDMSQLGTQEVQESRIKAQIRTHKVANILGNACICDSVVVLASLNHTHVKPRGYCNQGAGYICT